MDFNNLMGGDRVSASLRRANGVFSAGERVIARDPGEDMEFDAVVERFDREKGRMTLKVEWEPNVAPIVETYGSPVRIAHSTWPEVVEWSTRQSGTAPILDSLLGVGFVKVSRADRRTRNVGANPRVSGAAISATE
ncbi:hypothetical protein ACFT5B_03805 [Luteimicrobium sp. NPDC057192]|uniref:hypothetical protein n=1 Tax=Luteimicrobium sp. NPDC057192 TaxID=3346042 RepID=UPI00362BECAB